VWTCSFFYGQAVKKEFADVDQLQSNEPVRRLHEKISRNVTSAFDISAARELIVRKNAGKAFS